MGLGCSVSAVLCVFSGDWDKFQLNYVYPLQRVSSRHGSHGIATSHNTAC